MHKNEGYIQVTRVSEGDERVEESHRKAEIDNRILGEYSLKQHAKWDRRLRQLHNQGEEIVSWSEDVVRREMTDALEPEREHVRQILDGKDSMAAISIRQMFLDYAGSKRAEKREFDVLDYIEQGEEGMIVDIEDIPDKLLLDIFAFHKENMERRREEMEKDVEIWKGEFVEVCTQGINEGWLPISEDLLKKRIFLKPK